MEKMVLGNKKEVPVVEHEQENAVQNEIAPNEVVQVEAMREELENSSENACGCTEQDCTEVCLSEACECFERGEILYEDKENRSENGTVFVNNDGTTRAVFTAFASHYLDQSVKYQRIDNSLMEDGEALENKANAFKARFLKKPTDGVIYEMTKEGSKISLASLDAAYKAECALENCDCTDGQNNKVTVRDAAQNVDIQYSVESDRIKENIIVKEKSDKYVFDFNLKIENLEVALSEDGKNLELKNKTTGAVDYIIPQPFMFDARQVYSDDVYYEIAQETDNLLSIKVIAAEEFINAEDRAFPVTIDPQIVSSDSALFSNTYYYKYVSSGGSGSGYGNESGPYSGLCVVKNSSMEYRSNIVVKKSKLNLLDHKIMKATLKIRPSSINTSGYCYLNGIYTYIGSISDYSIDITNYMRNNSGDFTITINPSFNHSDITFNTGGSYAPMIEIEYLTNEKTKPKYETLSLAGGVAEARINLLTGEAAVVMADLKTGALALPVNISHVFKKSSENFKCGTNWRLNLHQTLKKETDSVFDSNFVFTDEKGDKHGFKDFYYHFDSNQKKVYVAKSNVSIEHEGRLDYNGNEVFKEQKSSLGYEIVSKEEGLINLDLIEQRSEEQIALEDKLESYYNTLKDCVRVNTDTGEILSYLKNSFSGKNISKTDFDNFYNPCIAYSNQMIMPESESLQLKSMIEQRTSCDNRTQAFLNTEASMNLQKAQLGQTYYTYNYTIDDLPDDKAGRKPTYEALRSNTSAQEQHISNQKSDLSVQVSENSKQRAGITAQINLQKNKKSLYMDNYKTYFLAYVRNQNEQKILERNAQEYFLLDSDKNVRAFNKKGDLVSIFDFYGNTLSIEYDSTGKITLVKDGEDKRVKFVYTNNLLSSLSDDEGLKISYTYQSNALKTVDTSNGTTVAYSYDDLVTGQISAIETSSKLRAKLTYKNRQLSSVEEMSLASKITNSGAVSSSEKSLSATVFSYDWYRTVVSKKEKLADADTFKSFYIFNANGNLNCYYTEKDNVTEDVLTHDFVDEKCSFTVKAKKTGFNYLSGISAKSASSKLLIKSIPASELQTVKADGSKDDKSTDYIFSCFATSTYSYTTAMRMQTEFYNQNMSSGTSAKFELCCELIYPNSEVKTFINSFDFRNKNKQFIALPVTLKENISGDAILPVSVNLYVDRTSNYGATFDTFTFCQADWNYNLLNQFGAPTLSETSWSQIAEDSFVKTETAFTYDDVQKLTKKRTSHYLNVNNVLKKEYSVERYTYNTYGDLLKSESYVEGEEQTKGIVIEETKFNSEGKPTAKVKYNSLDSGSKYYSESGVSENGSLKEKEKSDEKTVRSKPKTDGDSYGSGYDSMGNLSAVTMSTEDGEENATKINRTLGLITEIQSGLNTVNYEYDHKARKTAVKYNSDTNHVTYVHTDNFTENGKKVDKITASMIDGTVLETVTDHDGNILRTSCAGVDVTNTYENGKITKNYDGVTKQTYDYQYDAMGRLKNISGGGVTETLTYNEYGKPSVSTITAGATAQKYEYQYKDNYARDVDCVKLPNGLNIKVEQDPLGRAASKTLLNLTGNKYGEYYYYTKFGDRASNMPSTIRYGVFENGNYTIKDGLKYAYDKQGNISSICENGKLIVKYGYDQLNRLVREDNRKLNKTYLTAYDNNGNILAKRETGYTLKNTDELPLSDYADEKLYGYDGTFGDRLTSYDGTKFAYDLMGNPTYYRALANATAPNMGWSKGRQLDWYTPQGKAKVTFGYDGLGKRIKKGGITYTYLSDEKLLMQSDGVNTLEFVREGENIIGFKHSGKQYVYRKNVQGDVTHLYEYVAASLDLKLAACYTYDAWGAQKVYKVNSDGTQTEISDTSVSGNASHVGNLNPIRYRSYYYDSETCLYYLQSRYYDPETGRFVNADDISVLDETALDLNGINLYMYCGCNPVMRVDETGYAWWNWLISGIQLALGIVLCATGIGAGFGVGLIVGGTLGIIAQAAGPQIAQIIGGGGSIMNGWGAFTTGLSLLAFGPVGIVAGIALMAVGTATMAIGVNDIVAGVTGTNYLQKWTGMSDSAYGWLNFGLNMASAIGTLAGRIGMKVATNRAAAKANAAAGADATTSSSAKPDYKIDDRILAEASDGNPSFGTFRKKVWQLEARYNPQNYSQNNLKLMNAGKAPIMADGKMNLHHILGRNNGQLYNVVKLTQTQHIAFHQMYGYHYNPKWDLITW